MHILVRNQPNTTVVNLVHQPSNIISLEAQDPYEIFYLLIVNNSIKKVSSTNQPSKIFGVLNTNTQITPQNKF